MMIIKCVTDKIKEEIHDAESYIDLAIKWKEEEPTTAELFYELSNEEMEHMKRLHEAVTELIEKYREENGEPPKIMQMLYDELHKKQIEDSMMVKVKQAMYRE